VPGGHVAGIVEQSFYLSRGLLPLGTYQSLFFQHVLSISFKVLYTIFYGKSEILAGNLKMAVFWDVAWCYMPEEN
jgi:hypothetical protein